VIAHPRRVVITGLGVVAPNGIGKDRFWQSLIAGTSAVDHITAFDASPFATRIAAEVRDFDPTQHLPSGPARRMWRLSQFAVSSAILAVEDARLRLDPSHVSVCFGTTLGTVGPAAELHASALAKRSVRHALPILTESLPHAMTSHVAAALGVTGPTLTVSSNCCTGLDSIHQGYLQIRTGAVNVAIVGAYETPIFPLVVAAFSALGLLSTRNGDPRRASRPYDRLRDGLVLGEGAGALVLEELDSAIKRDAPIYAELVGYAGATDPSEARAPADASTALSKVIAAALRQARIDSSALDYISAHGSSLPATDLCDTTAFKIALGPSAYQTPISSIKSMIGQAISAGSMFQAISSCLAIRDRIIPPTINQEVRDPDCDLDYVPNRARPCRIDIALVNAHGMGGSTSALIIKRFVP
jgi:3-oxoacyl-[acyl-carrier-protein] synthase II